MNDKELVSLLLDNYSRQLDIFLKIKAEASAEKSEIEGLNGSSDLNASAGVIKKHVDILKKRSLMLDESRKIDLEIKNNKIGWDRRKNEIDFPEAEKLKAVISEIKNILAFIISCDKNFQKFNEETIAALKSRQEAT
ncbi:MAG: hypothetical protein ACLFQK_01640 [Fibrobacterota bacterium]